MVAVITGDQVRHLGPKPVNRAIPDMKVPPHPIIADGAVHAVGVPVVAIAAETATAAWDAAERLVVVDDELAAAAPPEAALAQGAAVLFKEVEGNRSFRRALRRGDPDAAFARAAHRVPLRIAQERISAVAMEPRTVVASFEGGGRADALGACQAPFRIRGEVARLLDLAEAQVRVIAPDVGGGFGVKTGPYREEVLLAWLAVRLAAAPLGGDAPRGHFTTNHARGSVCEGELALDTDGRILALRARVVSPLGASMMNAAAGSPWNHPRCCPART